MAEINKSILVGNLGRDPDIRYAQSGMAICKMRLAVTERVKDGVDGWKDATECPQCQGCCRTSPTG
jgi:single-strand DNA-binding protein